MLELAEHAWRDAVGEVEEGLHILISNIDEDLVKKCESLLIEIKTLIRRQLKSGDANVSDKLQTLCEEYMSLLPRKASSDVALKTIRDVAREQNTCQVRVAVSFT